MVPNHEGPSIPPSSNFYQKLGQVIYVEENHGNVNDIIGSSLKTLSETSEGMCKLHRGGIQPKQPPGKPDNSRGAPPSGGFGR